MGAVELAPGRLQASAEGAGVTGSDRDDVVAIVAHLTRIVLRHSGSETEQPERLELAGEIASALCDALALDNEEVSVAALGQARAMVHPQ